MEKIVGVAQLYFMPHPLLEIVQRLMAHPVFYLNFSIFISSNWCYFFMMIQKNCYSLAVMERMPFLFVVCNLGKVIRFSLIFATWQKCVVDHRNINNHDLKSVRKCLYII